MDKADQKRLKNLMAHYRQPYTQSMIALLEERAKHKTGEIPTPKWREEMEERGAGEEWEGPFFCRILSELLEPKNPWPYKVWKKVREMSLDSRR